MSESSCASDPFSWVREDARPRLLIVLGVLLAIVTGWLLAEGRALVTEAAPNGVVSLELAGTRERAAEILGSWSPRAREAFAFVQGLDTLYLVLYAGWLSLAVASLARRLRGAWRRVGLALSWLILLAGGLDLVENWALDVELARGASAFHARLAWACALPKFALVALAGAFLAIGLAAWLRDRRRAG